MVSFWGGWGWQGLVGVSLWCVSGLVPRGGGMDWGRHRWWRRGQGWVLCWTGDWASCRVVWVLLVRAVRFLGSLAGRGVGLQVGGSCLSIWVGLWSVGSGWLLVDGACSHGLRVGGLLVVVGCSL